MKKTTAAVFFSLTLLFFFSVSAPFALARKNETKTSEKAEETPQVTISEEMGETILREASEVKEEIQQKAVSMFDRRPLGWDENTVKTLYEQVVRLPQQLPATGQTLLVQGRVLGAAGTVIVALFIAILIYSLWIRKKAIRAFERYIWPYHRRFPPVLLPLSLIITRIIIRTLLPLLLLIAHSLVDAVLTIDLKWYLQWYAYLGELLRLWLLAALLVAFFQETLVGDAALAEETHGRPLMRWARILVWYTMVGLAIVKAGALFHFAADVMAFFRFLLGLSIVVLLFLIHLKKQSLLSLLPRLPYRNYHWFHGFLSHYYYPLIFVTLGAALLWVFGYTELGWLLVFKPWSTAGAYVGIMLVFHQINKSLQNWAAGLDARDETGQFLLKSCRSLLIYITVLATVIILLNMLGFLDPLHRIFSFPIITFGTSTLTFWSFVYAVLIILAALHVSRFSQAYLDYKVFPALGVETGLGYTINTLVKYGFIALGLLIALKTLGIDFRFLMIFAGAIGLGIGFGLQSMAVNLISGMSLIFSGMVRKGDWIEINGTLGKVTDIFLHSTNLRSRDNIEYLVPNAKLLSDTLVNYSLSSSLVRLHLAVGVSYDADPDQVRDILEKVARAEPLVSGIEPPVVRFAGYGDNSIDFELLFWADMRLVAPPRVRSALYFAIFRELREAGIEIPFPQRDLHIKSML